jgi:hypothetical protein
MQYENIVKDFALRTLKNLNALRDIQRNQPSVEVYEITQLINSMLGLLVFPQQRYVNNIPKVPLAELANRDWPIPEVVGNYPQVKNLNQLLRYLRNAIAHFNLEFISDENKNIEGLRVWNVDPRTGEITWKARLTKDDIEKISRKFVELLLER